MAVCYEVGAKGMLISNTHLKHGSNISTKERSRTAFLTTSIGVEEIPGSEVQRLIAHYDHLRYLSAH